MSLRALGAERRLGEHFDGAEYDTLTCRFSFGAPDTDGRRGPADALGRAPVRLADEMVRIMRSHADSLTRDRPRC